LPREDIAIGLAAISPDHIVSRAISQSEIGSAGIAHPSRGA
jgi:hypothetical protein